MSARALFLGLAIAAAHLVAGAQQIHRCGNLYTDVPCPLLQVPEVHRFADTPRTVSDPPAPGWAGSPAQYDGPRWHSHWHGHHGGGGGRAGHHGRAAGTGGGRHR